MLSFLWPIKKGELKKFIPMALMLLLTIFNYNTLKAMKDSFIVPNIGAEAVSFVKFYFVVPAAILLVLFYIKLANLFSLNQIYILFGLFYFSYFLLFAFLLYPNQDLLHPDPNAVTALINSSIDLKFFSLHLSYFKWFLLVYGKWLYIIFYVLAELWGSSMIFLLFWQFSNQIVPTDQAKRFYPMLNLMGSLGTFFSGGVIKFIVDIKGSNAASNSTTTSVQALLLILASFALLILLLLLYTNKKVLFQERCKKEVRTGEIKKKLPLMDSIRVIFASKYLGYIVVLVLSYGIAINLLEGPWKAKLRELYTETNNYIYFMGNINQWNGILAVFFSLVGVTILKKYSWFAAAIITPIMIFTTGIAFFSFVVFDNMIYVLMSSFFFIDPLFIAIMLGATQNILSKSSKYGLFDPTKEMTYIPIEEELKSKGKAAVDVLGARFAKSGAAFIQSSIFIIFPTATYSSISPFLMVIFTIIALIWIIDVNLLNKEYLQYLKKFKEKTNRA